MSKYAQRLGHVVSTQTQAGNSVFESQAPHDTIYRLQLPETQAATVARVSSSMDHQAIQYADVNRPSNTSPHDDLPLAAGQQQITSSSQHAAGSGAMRPDQEQKQAFDTITVTASNGTAVMTTIIGHPLPPGSTPTSIAVPQDAWPPAPVPAQAVAATHASALTSDGAQTKSSVVDTVQPKRGAFIVFEGLDRSGKTTQVNRLRERLSAEGQRVEAIHFPDRSTEMGKLIDAYLRKAQQTNTLDDHAVHLLFVANRWEVQARIRRWIADGVTVLCDRYAFSGTAFSSAKGLNASWCMAPEAGLPAPDAVFFLYVSPEEQLKRGGFGKERYENKDMQTKAAAGLSLFCEADERWYRVDANQTIDLLSSELLTRVQHVMKNASTLPLMNLDRTLRVSTKQ